MDLDALELGLAAAAAAARHQNAGGGQPRSRRTCAACALADFDGVPRFLDACRFAENAYFIQCREPGHSVAQHPRHRSRNGRRCAYGTTTSAKKDPMGNIGGWLALHDYELAERCHTIPILDLGLHYLRRARRPRPRGHRASGLVECVQQDYLRYRIASPRSASATPCRPRAPRLSARSAVTPSSSTPARCSPTSIRSSTRARRSPPRSTARAASARASSARSGPAAAPTAPRRPPRWTSVPASAIPRRTDTQSHFDYASSRSSATCRCAAELEGFRITQEPAQLRHFQRRRRSSR